MTSACDDLAVVARDGDHAAVVGAADVLAGDPDVDVRDVDAGHPLGLFGRRLDRPDRLLEVGHDAFAHARRGGLADPDDLEPVGPGGGDDGTGLGRADIEPANGLVLHPMLTCSSISWFNH